VSQIKFRPWIGPAFNERSVRLLILGESQYGDPDPDLSRSTITVVEKWQAREWSIRYLIAACRLITGKAAWEVDRYSDLDGCAFYNFVQTMMPDRSHRPSAAHFQSSFGAFREVLHELRPTHLLATGKTLWNHMPGWDGKSGQVELGGQDVEIGEYETGAGFCLAIHIPHISMGFSPPAWRDVFSDFLSVTKFPA
jgi:hypothetical protein